MNARRERPARGPRGVTPEQARQLLLGLAGVEPGRSYGFPAFKLDGRFFARFRDHDAVLVLALGSIAERDVLLRLDPRAFFLTDHYRDHPTVLIRLADVPVELLQDVLGEAHGTATERRPAGGTKGAATKASRRAPPSLG